MTGVQTCALPIFFDHDQVIAHYADATGADMTHLDWYEVFAYYKLAIIVAGIHARYLLGMTRGDGFEHMGLLVDSLAASALDRASASNIPGLRG